MKLSNQEVIFYLIALRKCWNISVISVSHSRSNITTHDLTLATVSRIAVLLTNEQLDLSDKFSKDDTISWKTSCIHINKNQYFQMQKMILKWSWNLQRYAETMNSKYLHMVIIIRSIWCSYPCYLADASSNCNFDIIIRMSEKLLCNQCFDWWRECIL